ncbi:MAG: VOC family protein [Sphingobacterium composti]|uniref:VOC family protein n=1 Tax=Sphingobacterium composti TaxID=363260 RepID=UPI001F35FF0D|nr:VOC family protein [Sphingobacterium composti Ten et al. 2007 non Yoo et al. 2007]
MKISKPIYTCLWFEDNALDAATFYCSIFEDAHIEQQNPFALLFKLNGTTFMALHGGPKYFHSPAVSFVIDCDTQEQIDYFWEKLGADGRYDRCGWLTDKFGISWQIVPTILPQLMADESKRDNVVKAFMQMSKFDIQTLLEA